MADKVVSLKVLVDTKTGQVNVEELNGDLKNTVKATEKIGTESKVASSKMSEGFSKTGDTVGALNPRLGGMIKGIQGATKAAIAFIATPFGMVLAAIVLALGALMSYFTKTERGADKFRQALAAIQATVTVLIDRFSSFGEGIFQIFSGDFSKGVDTLKKSFQGIGDEIAREAKEAVGLTKRLSDLEDAEIALIEVNERKKTQIAELRLLSTDEDKSKKERLIALQEAAKLENEIADAEIAIAKERASIITAQVAQGESLAEDLRKQAEANAVVIRLEGERAMSLRSLNKEMKRLRETEKEADKELTEEMKQRLNSFKDIADSVKKSGITEAVINEVQTINNELLKLPEAIGESTIKSMHIIATSFEQEYGFVSDGLNALASLVDSFEPRNEAAAKRQFQMQKSLRMTQAIMDTYVGATSAFAETPGGVVVKSIAAGIATIAGLARVNAIKNTRFNATQATAVSPSSGGSVSGGGQSGTRADATFTPIAPQSFRRTRKGDTVKVVVVESEIREVTDRINGITAKAVVE